MELDPQNALSAIQAGIRQASALIVTYSFSVLGAVLLLVIGFVVAGLVERWIYAGLGQVSGFDLTLRRFFSKIARYVVLGLVVVMVLGQFGIQTASVIAAIGAVGLAIGLALQGTLQNIAAGIMLLALRPLRIGEYVEVGSIPERLKRSGFSLRDCALPTASTFLLPIRPCGRNRSKTSREMESVATTSRLRFQTPTILTEFRNPCSAWRSGMCAVRKEPTPTAFVAELGDSTMDITLRYWTSVSDFLSAKVELNKSVRNILNGSAK